MADSWFSYLQSQICKEFENIDGGRKKFIKRNWSKKKFKDGGGTSFLLTDGKILKKLELTNQLFLENLKKNLEQKYLEQTKMEFIGLQEFQL